MIARAINAEIFTRETSKHAARCAPAEKFLAAANAALYLRDSSLRVTSQ
jgi:hypothetical protein